MKNAHFKLIFSVFVSFGVLSLVNGQQKAMEEEADRLIETSDFIKFKGIVTAFNNYYVKNAEVTSKRSGSKAITDSLGMFEIMAPGGDVLIFRAKGFEKNRRKVSVNEDEITVNMILVPGEKNQKMAVDYGHMYEKDMVYAVEHYSHFNNDYMVYNDMRELLQAELLGTRVTNQGSIQVFIRGRDIGSYGLSENNGAVTFVLDGMIVRDIDFLNPRDVRSIRLLRGHEASRMYGSLGANGVVLINTKY
jgi:hypothetical protein